MAEPMKTGPELDKKIGDLVGWAFDEVGYLREWKEGGFTVRFPSYSVSDAFAAAGTHLMDLRCNGGRYEMSWRCRWLAEQPGETDVEAHADTPALAICRAMLMAAEVRTKELDPSQKVG